MKQPDHSRFVRASKLLMAISCVMTILEAEHFRFREVIKLIGEGNNKDNKITTKFEIWVSHRKFHVDGCRVEPIRLTKSLFSCLNASQW